MKQVLKFVLGLALVLIFATFATFAAGLTLMTVRDAMASRGSLDRFEAHIRHYSDRMESDRDGIRVIRAPHPFALHFGMLALSWAITVVSAMGLRRLFSRTFRAE